MVWICHVCGEDLDKMWFESKVLHLKLHPPKSGAELAAESLERFKKAIIGGGEQGK